MDTSLELVKKIGSNFDIRLGRSGRGGGTSAVYEGWPMVSFCLEIHGSWRKTMSIPLSRASWRTVCMVVVERAQFRERHRMVRGVGLGAGGGGERGGGEGGGGGGGAGGVGKGRRDGGV